jgi:hypothetical protein
MNELTLSQILEEAFEHARDLDAPLSVRLATFADAARVASPDFADAVDRLVTRLKLTGAGATAPAVGETMPPFMLSDDQGHLLSLEQLLAKGPCGAVLPPWPLVPLLPAQHECSRPGANGSRTF